MNSGFNKSLYLAWVVALVAVAGSLYFSEIAGFLPCKLCWFQRILMYPLVIILGIACYRNDRDIARYVIPLSIIGGVVSIIHLGEQKLHLFAKMCQAGVPCSGEYINWLGFITIPLLALIAFTIITITLWISLRKK